MDVYLQSAAEKLVKDRVINAGQLRKAAQAAAKSGQSVVAYLVESGLVGREPLLESLSAVSGIPAFDLTRQRVAPEIAQLIPRATAVQRGVLPVGRDGGKLVVVMRDPSDIFALHQVMELTGQECVPRIIYSPDLPEAVERAFAVRVPGAAGERPDGEGQGANVATAGRGARFVVATRAARYDQDSGLRKEMVRDLGVSRAVKLESFVTSRVAPTGTPVSAEDRQRMLDQNLIHLTEPGSETERIRGLLRLADRLCDAEGSSLLLLSEDGGELCFAEATGEKAPELLKIRLPLDEKSIAGYTLTHRQTIRLDDADSDPRQSKDTDRQLGFHTRSMISCPIFLEGLPVGVLQVVNKRSGSFDYRDVEQVQVLAAQAGVAVGLSRAGAQERRQRRQIVNGLRRVLDLTGLLDLERGGQVGEMAAGLARRLRMPARQVEGVEMAASLHGLDRHGSDGLKILGALGLHEEARLIRHRGEHFDGGGRPEGLAGDSIPRGARILAVAAAWVEATAELGSPARAFEHLRSGFGTHFDPELREPLEVVLDLRPAVLS